MTVSGLGEEGVYGFLYRRRQLLALTLGLTLLTSLLSYQRLSSALDWLWFDLTQQLSRLPPADDLVIIEIDEKSIQSLGRWPWSRGRHAQLLQRLSMAETRAVVFDVIFADVDVDDPDGDQALARAIGQQGKVILPMYLQQLGNQGQVLEVTPAALFYQPAAGVGHVHVAPDRDGVVRSLFLREGLGSPYWPHLSLALQQTLQADHTRALPGSAGYFVGQENNPHVIARDYHNWLPMPAAGQGIVHHSFIDVLEGRVELNGLRDKVVFVGATAAGLGDIFTTSVGSMPGVELNAWAYHALRHQRTIERLSDQTVITIHIVAVLLLVVFLGHLSPAAFLLATLGALLGVLLSSSLLQLWGGWWLPVAPIAVALLLFYPLWSWLRLEVALGYLRAELQELNRESRQSTVSLSRGFLAGTELVEQTIDQLNRAKQQALADRRLIEYSLEKLQDAVIIADLSGQIELLNGAAKELLAISVNGQADALLDLLAPVEPGSNRTWGEVLRQLLSEGESLTLQARHSQGDRDLFVQAGLASIVTESPDTVIITLTDVSELKAAEKARLEALNFLSHDLRSPLVSVLAIIGVQRSEKPHAPEEALDDIEVLVRKNLSYADSFLQLSRAQSLQKSQLHLCDLHAVLDGAQMQGIALAKGKHIVLHCERTDEDAWVMGEHDMLERALLNLISNAVKYSLPYTEIYLSLERAGEQLQFVVRDQGKGIASVDLPTVFDRFTRSSKHQQEKGAGLGLHFVATVARRHHGRVTVESTEGQGSRFVIVLPAYSPAEDEL